MSINDYLTNEIRNIKRESFPELKWLYVNGVYLPDNELLKRKSFIETRPFAFRNGELVFGFIFVRLPLSLSPYSLYEERTGGIAHELSHFVVSSTFNENDVNREVILRGYGRHLYNLSYWMEGKGIKSNTSTKEISKLLCCL